MAVAIPPGANGLTLNQVVDRYLARMEQRVHNALTARQEWLRGLFDPRRDIEDECGHPKNPSISEYQELYEKDAVSRRVVEVWPRECWQVQPTVYELENVSRTTAFERTWDTLSQQLRGEESFYQDEYQGLVWDYLKRADEVSGIGQYGVMLLGLDDGRDLATPASPSANGTLRKLLFLRVLPQHMAEIESLERDLRNPRYGKPVMYSLTLADPRNPYGSATNPSGSSSINPAATTTSNPPYVTNVRVHWSRVVHIADNVKPDEVFGMPRMEPVLYRLLDIRKVVGGSAEMYWKGAFPGLVVESQAGAIEDADIDLDSVRDAVERYQNGLQRFLRLLGMTAKQLSPQVVDPSKQFDVQLTCICIQLGIPKRVFMGSERGELASSQDDAAWNDRLRERQCSYITPRVIVPFVDRLIAVGVLPRPRGYSISWPDVTSQSLQDRANVAVAMTQAMVQYVTGNAEAIMTVQDFLTRVMKFNEDEARTIVDAAKKGKATRLTPDTSTMSEGVGAGAGGGDTMRKDLPKPRTEPETVRSSTRQKEATDRVEDQ